jgi:hypothetical protein
VLDSNSKGTGKNKSERDSRTFRHLILLVEAEDENGNLLRQESGSVLPPMVRQQEKHQQPLCRPPGKGVGETAQRKMNACFSCFGILESYQIGE